VYPLSLSLIPDRGGNLPPQSVSGSPRGVVDQLRTDACDELPRIESRGGWGALLGLHATHRKTLKQVTNESHNSHCVAYSDWNCLTKIQRCVLLRRDPNKPYYKPWPMCPSVQGSQEQSRNCHYFYQVNFFQFCNIFRTFSRNPHT